MSKHLYILTGASRGMGAAMAEQLLGADNVLLCISRHVNEALATQAKAGGMRCDQWPLDLAQGNVVSERVQDWLGGMDRSRFASATLINNAAALTHIGPLEECNDAELASALRVGLEAPLLLTAAFLRATTDWSGQRRVLNISSGLGRRPMAAQAPYCAAKAGMDHFSRCVALDEAQKSNGARIVALAPGVIDTDMQVHLRAADPAGFPDRANFVGLKDNGQLTSASEAATKVLAFLRRADFGSNPVADVRDV
ncbi:SDR family oxidoreductase [soil metagenome]